MLTFRILGPLEVVRDGESLPLGPAKQRALVACLLLHPNETVSIDRLTDELWGQDAPPRAERNLYQHVFRLRQVFAEEGRAVLVTRPPGYRIELAPDDVVDATQFEGLVRSARDVLRNDPAEALELLERGLALWRGPALVDFAYEAFAEASAWRLEEIRATAEEARIEALLALGRENDAIPEVEALVQRFPLREHVRALQMLALYRAGRQSEALNALQSARQALAAELGIDPGPELRSLEAAILRHDPDLQLPRSVDPVETSAVSTVPATDGQQRPAPPDGESDGSGRGRRRARVIPVVALAAVVAVVIAVAAVALDEDEPSDPSGPTASTAAAGELRLEWQEAPSGDFVGPGDQRFLGGVETMTGYLVFGHTTTDPNEAGGKPDLDTVVWVGDPDQQWDAVESLSFGGEGNQRATDAVVFGEHAIVLVGSSELAHGFDAAAWILQGDSDQWERADKGLEGLHEEQDQSIRDAVQIGSQLIAVGSTGTPRDADAALWTSQRGTEWTFQDGAPAGEDGAEEMTGITKSLDGLFVIGGFVDDGSDRDAAVWTATSPQFVHRVKLPETKAALGGDGDQQINSIVLGGPGFVAVGEETVDSDTDAVVWTSADGRHWDRVTDTSGAFGGEGEQRMYAVTASDAGLVAAGSDKLPAVADDGEFDLWDAAVWTSVDGEDWVRLPGDQPSMSALADIGHQEIKALLTIEGGFLALGAEAESASDWDGRVWIGTPVP